MREHGAAGRLLASCITTDGWAVSSCNLRASLKIYETLRKRKPPEAPRRRPGELLITCGLWAPRYRGRGTERHQFCYPVPLPTNELRVVYLQ
ncbi:hypothetical protein E2C01_036539 [Portunus trituberculatus]|uniref:Uncharacterized protein n=1 Tax=Portunus trituberculatus TaxID=210409 RepID=A0A5B7FC79_PORTR|nr:hypothetical protein [Portunus trituberculatus]